MMRTIVVVAACTLAALTACGPTTPPVNGPSLAAPATPQSAFCAPENPCPGMYIKKYQVCGECDPETRYFKQRICSLGEKLRNVVNSCVKGKVGVRFAGKELFGSKVQGCVKQQLQNEPLVLKSYIALASEHKVSDKDKREWRQQCDAKWSQFIITHPDAITGPKTRPVAQVTPIYKKWWFWTIIGAAAAGAGAAVVIGTQVGGASLTQVPWSSMQQGLRR
ncbi:MAG: hypothetical protein KC503_16270 [Myxococcales bacterium]|nr:hypothetical protein [Myxococcales bacterium]